MREKAEGRRARVGVSGTLRGVAWVVGLIDARARLTGETVTGAITVALRERLEREKRRSGADVLARELHAVGERCAKLMGPGPSAVEHGDMLYDERGLPK